jgi:pyridoxine 4-dehydrogenase
VELHFDFLDPLFFKAKVVRLMLTMHNYSFILSLFAASAVHGWNNQHPFSRRQFYQEVQTTAITAATLGLPQQAAVAQSTTNTAPLTSISLPPLGLGAWAWGDSLFWGYNPKNDAELQQVFDYAMTQSNNGIYTTTLFDTAELYGLGRSELLIGDFAKQYPPEQIQIATKFAPLPWRTQPQSVVQACQASVKRLGNRPIDLYQIHFPGAWSNAEYWDGLAMAYEQGLVKAVGVSNYGVDALRACHAALAQRGIPLATNQIQMSLLYRHPLENGLAQACQDLGVQILSYSPLALGMLTGKYTPERPPQGPRKLIFEKLKSTPDYDNLLRTMQEIADGHVGATPAQVALNWARAKGTIPIPGARTLQQVQSNYGALQWSLSEGEVKALDLVAAKVQTFNQPQDNPFPTVDKNTGLRMYDS